MNVTKTAAVLVLLIVIFAALVVLTGFLIASGYIISAIFPLTLFEASLLAASAGLTVVLGVVAIQSIAETSDARRSPRTSPDFDEEDDDGYGDDDDDEDDAWEDDDPPEESDGPQPTLGPRRRIGRNEKCPCGSGRKYKNCCGG